MNAALFSNKIKEQARQQATLFKSRALAAGGIIPNESFVNNYYEFMLRTFGYIPRRVYSSLAGVKLNNIAGTDYVQTLYDLNNTSPVDAVQLTAANQPLWDVDSDISHRTLRFDGTNDFMNIDDLSIFRNQGAGTLWSVAKDTAPSGGVSLHSLVTVTNNTLGNSRLSIQTRHTATSQFRVVSRRLDGDTGSLFTEANNASYNSHSLVANWSGNMLTPYRNKIVKTSQTFSSGAGLTSDTDSFDFQIGTVSNNPSNFFPGTISEIHADRSVYTQAQINALHEFFKRYYPTLP